MNFFVISLLLSFNILLSQTVYESIESDAMGTSRDLKIQLPRNYEQTPDKRYPLIVVFDGDYLFELVAGNVDYYSYWEDMPEAIVVGVKQIDSKAEDTTLSIEGHFPHKTGAKFYDFIERELIPYIRENYRSLDFSVAVGHGQTANFINFFLFSKALTFNAFIALSPSLSFSMQDNLSRQLSLKKKEKIFYYLSTANLDIKRHKKEVLELNAKLTDIDNNSLLYSFDNFEAANHYSLAAQSIPKALESIFLVYQPISKKEYKEKIISLETSPVDYLIEKYDTIDQLFGIEKQMLINDFRAIEAAIKKQQAYALFKDLGDLANQQYPNTVLGSFYLGRYYEEKGNPKKAMNIYRSAYILESVEGYSKEEMFDRADQIRDEYGY